MEEAGAQSPSPAVVDLSILIVNWNSAEFVRKCLTSIYAHPPRLSFEVVVVDSASFDDCGEMIAKNFPQVKFVQSRENLGFGKANNLAFRNSRGGTVLLLNPDTEVIGDAIEVLFASLQRLPAAGAVGCKLLNSDGSVQTSCIQSFPTVINQVLDAEVLRARMPRSPLWGMAPLFSNSTEPSAVEAISGACVMLRRELFAAIGGFEERYFMYSEDLDLSFKVHGAGYRCYYVPTASIVHHGGGSTRSARSLFSVVMMRESVYQFMRLRRGPVSAALFRVALGASALARIPAVGLVAILHGFRSHAGSLRKWFAILDWSVRREKCIQTYRR